MSQQGFSKFGKLFVSYGSYHHNIVNKWIHIICVPLISASLIAALSFIPYSVNIAGHTIGPAQISTAFLLAFYATINVTFALGISVATAGLALAWRYAFSGLEDDTALKIYLAIHVIAWIFQFIGHGVFEKRKPALLDNFGQVLSAPLFVLAEVLEMVGIQPSEMKTWNAQILKNVEQFRKKDHKN